MAEATISIRTPDGKDTGPIPMSTMKKALKTLKSDRDTRTSEMFSAEETGEATAHTVAAGQLRAIIERIERLESEKADIALDIREIYQEAKGTGFNGKAIRSLVKLRKKDQAERQEEESILDLYKAALGMA